MNKLAKFVSCVIMITLSGSVFAQSDIQNSALESVIAGTDAQLVPALSGALDQGPENTFPAPSRPDTGTRNIQLSDITDQCISQYDVVSAYPALYNMIPNEENFRVIKVFRFTDGKGGERRIEVYYTGGDWMQYGLVYFGINAEQNKDQANAYFIGDLSTPDREEGSVAPKIDPFNPQQLADFIVADFLETDGSVKAMFGIIATATASVK
ncbi:MAG: hypothetical protein A2218_08470 [Elusimicrobia bacterium RIFOXYA2_FULL_53_38]|nr:MAG: hypothetical protein A2218_08470 [Elusimicrobia bacterium RIFOXYA2_FULL_53_38]